MEAKFKLGDVLGVDLDDKGEGFVFVVARVTLTKVGVGYYDAECAEFSESRLALVCKAENREA